MDQEMGSFEALAQLVLASASPRRRELLGQAGLTFEVRPAVGAEPDPAPGEDAAGFAVRAAAAKAREVAAGCPDAVVLGADTVVVLDGEILGKPADAAHALAMLRGLSGRSHEVVTGCCLIRTGPVLAEEAFFVRSEVVMGPWPDQALAAYAATGEPMDKAGAYAIQGQGAFLVREVRGSYTNVVGLPLAEIVEVLEKWGVAAPRGA